MVKKLFEFLNTDGPATWKHMLVLFVTAVLVSMLMIGLLSLLPPGPCEDLSKLTYEEKKVCEEREFILPPGRSFWG